MQEYLQGSIYQELMSRVVTVEGMEGGLENWASSVNEKLDPLDEADLISRCGTLESKVSALEMGKQDKFSGTDSQYVRGDGSLASFPSMPAAQIQSDWNQTNTSAADFIKNKPSRTYANPTRSLNSAFLISSTRDSLVRYSITITSAATLLLGSRGTVYLRYADDSGFTTNVKEVDRQGFGVGSGLVVTGYSTISVGGPIPAGKYVQIVTENTSGTPTFAFNSAQEVLV